MRTGLGCTLTPPQRASDRLFRVPVVVQYKIRVTTGSLQPALDFLTIVLQDKAHHPFGDGAIGVRRCSRNTFLSSQSRAELFIAASNVLSKRVASGTFVNRQIVSGA